MCSYLYFLNKDISVTIYNTSLEFKICIHEIIMEGSMSQIFDLGLSFYSIKSRKMKF